MILETIAVAVITALIITCLWWKGDRPLAVILTLAYLLRLFVLYADSFQFFGIPFAGADTEDFHRSTLAFLYADGPIKTNYTYVLAAVYWIFGESGRFMAQYLNVLLSFGAVLLLCRTLRRVGVARRTLLLAVSVLSFMPSVVCLSGVLLREAWILFFLTLSASCFVRWYVKGEIWTVLVCLAATMGAMLMHAGCVGALCVYTLGFLVCRTWKTVGVRKYLSTAGVIVAALLVLLLFPDLLLAKFRNAMADGNNLEVKLVEAGSSYLLWMKDLPVALRLLLSPVRMFYLLFSPLPLEWRSVMDSFVFAVDSLAYMVLVVLMFRRPLLGKTAQLKRFLIYTVFGLTFVFAMGTTNAGTAVRHRAKFLPVMLVASTMLIERRKAENKVLDCDI